MPNRNAALGLGLLNCLSDRLCRLDLEHRVDGENIYAEVKQVAKV